MIVSDSSPLIVLGKQGYLDLLKKCFNKVIISKQVFNEIFIKENSVETIALRKALEEKWIVVEEININELLENANIQKGEKEALSLAFKHKLPLFTDDATAKSYSLLFNLEAHGSLYVILLSYKKKFINKDKAKELLDSVIKEGLYVSEDLISTFLDALEYIK